MTPVSRLEQFKRWFKNRVKPFREATEPELHLAYDAGWDEALDYAQQMLSKPVTFTIGPRDIINMKNRPGVVEIVSDAS